MVFTPTNPVSVDEATKADHYDVVFDNIFALSNFRIDRPLGGSELVSYTDTSYVPIINFAQPYIDGTNLSGLFIYFRCIAYVTAGTGYVRLYNGNLGAAVAGSETTFTNTSPQVKTKTITLASGSTNYYYAQVKGSVTSALPRVWAATIECRGS